MFFFHLLSHNYVKFCHLSLFSLQWAIHSMQSVDFKCLPPLPPPTRLSSPQYISELPTGQAAASIDVVTARYSALFHETCSKRCHFATHFIPLKLGIFIAWSMHPTSGWLVPHGEGRATTCVIMTCLWTRCSLSGERETRKRASERIPEKRAC